MGLQLSVNESINYTVTVTKLFPVIIKVAATHTHTHSPTVVGAGSRVFGAGLADDVLVDLVPLVLIVAPVERHKSQV